MFQGSPRAPRPSSNGRRPLRIRLKKLSNETGLASASFSNFFSLSPSRPHSPAMVAPSSSLNSVQVRRGFRHRVCAASLGRPARGTRVDGRRGGTRMLQPHAPSSPSCFPPLPPPPPISPFPLDSHSTLLLHACVHSLTLWGTPHLDCIFSSCRLRTAGGGQGGKGHVCNNCFRRPPLTPAPLPPSCPPPSPKKKLHPCPPFMFYLILFLLL
jgi:hypothetical protein